MRCVWAGGEFFPRLSLVPGFFSDFSLATASITALLFEVFTLSVLGAGVFVPRLLSVRAETLLFALLFWVTICVK